jgi:hypothetical protein
MDNVQKHNICKKKPRALPPERPVRWVALQNPHIRQRAIAYKWLYICGISLGLDFNDSVSSDDFTFEFFKQIEETW